VPVRSPGRREGVVVRSTRPSNLILPTHLPGHCGRGSGSPSWKCSFGRDCRPRSTENSEIRTASAQSTRARAPPLSTLHPSRAAGSAALVIHEMVPGQNVGSGTRDFAGTVVVEALDCGPRVSSGEANFKPPRLAKHPCHREDLTHVPVLSQTVQYLPSTPPQGFKARRGPDAQCRASRPGCERRGSHAFWLQKALSRIPRKELRARTRARWFPRPVTESGRQASAQPYCVAASAGPSPKLEDRRPRERPRQERVSAKAYLVGRERAVGTVVARGLSLCWPGSAH
jgi:hypothetical protein